MKWRQHFPPDAVELTPNGTRIEFYDAKKKTDTTPGQKRHYLADGEQPDFSVTSALDVLDKPALKGWAERMGVKGSIALAQEGKLPSDEWAALALMQERDLRWWQVRDQAGGRGTLTHSDLVKLMVEGKVPDEDAYPPEQLGFIRGGCGWFADLRPEVLGAEQMVASTLHGFAGRFDFRLRLRDGRVGIVDLKTTEEIRRDKNGPLPPYLEHVLQVEAYELASVECGYDPTDFRAVVRVDASGEYDMTESWVSGEDYLRVLECAKTVRNAKPPKNLYQAKAVIKDREAA